jgi:predicted enzyme related to lactoylglutathione lyase
MQQTATKIGRFVWHDMMTTDFGKSSRFYQELFGWGIEDFRVNEQNVYKMILAGTQGIAGFIEEPEIPSHWIGYVTVEDVDAACERARARGGQAPVPGTDIPNIGRFAVISHGDGGYVSPFAPKNLEGSVPEAEPIQGRFCWNQLMAKDPEKAAEFYEDVFGWTTTVQDLGDEKYWLFKSGGVPTAGMMKMGHGHDYPDFWLPYVEVSSVDDSVKRVKELGGEIIVPARDIPDLARFAVTADPTGAILAISTHGRP